jgi:oxygen-independent coproporphyrinogen-3 oxidase
MQERQPFASLYVHVPFCVRKCDYCDFYSVPPRAASDLDDYLDAVALELDRAPRAALRTIYIGGGTPTMLPPEALRRLLDLIRLSFDLSGLSEFTVEANPGALDAARVDALLEAGVNRFSLGVQSMTPSTLKTLGRAQGPEDARSAVGLLRRRGLSNLCLDLIFGVPGQTLDSWLGDLRSVLRFAPEHLSVYGLSAPPHTVLGRRIAGGDVSPVSDDLYAEMMQAAHELLAGQGYEHYEISNYALPGRRCQHNMVYWRNEAYLGCGPAAASYVNNRRWTNVADIQAYAKRLRQGESPVEQAEELSGQRRARETAVLSLRTADGLVLSRFSAATGFDPFELFAYAIQKHVASGLLVVDQLSIRLKPAAYPVADTVLADFVS